MHTLLFPGQGVQRKGMGAGLFEEFHELTAMADRVLGYSIADLCLRDPHRQLRDTRYAQPAVFFVNLLLGRRQLDAHPRYDYFAGHSLGEYNALVAAGVLDAEAALVLVKRRGELMSEISGGGMAAVMGMPAAIVQRALTETGLSQVFVANRNADTETTIAGERAELAVAGKSIALLPGARVVPINISGAFHTPLMAPAESAFGQVLAQYSFAPGHTPVMSSVTGEVLDTADAAAHLARQLTAPVEWVRTVTNLRAAGVTHFDEVHGQTLTALIARIH